MPPLRLAGFQAWWDQNWKWAVPVGCFGLLIVTVVGGLAMVALIFAIMRSTDPYQHALQRVQHDPEIVAVLGEPITPGWYVLGNIESSGASGTAALVIPVSGPRGRASVLLESRKVRGQWQFDYLAVNVEGRADSIVLVGPEAQSRHPQVGPIPHMAKLLRD